MTYALRWISLDLSDRWSTLAWNISSYWRIEGILIHTCITAIKNCNEQKTQKVNTIEGLLKFNTAKNFLLILDTGVTHM